MRLDARRKLALIGAAALLLLAGCGSSGEDSGSSASGKPRTATFGGPDNGRPVKPATPGEGGMK